MKNFRRIMLKIALVGYGNIGRFALKALEAAGDMECCGVVRRSASAEGCPELSGYRIVKDPRELGSVDAAVLCVPSRLVEQTASEYLSLGISTVDSFDIHSEIFDLRSRLDAIAKANGAASIISAGWDPGSDSIVRALLRALAPEGITYTNFGPGRSMGHTVVAKSVPGVKDALSMTIPEGKGVHSRKVYVETQPGADFAAVAAAIKADPYFASDKTDVEQVADVPALNTLMHGVDIEREGVSSQTLGQEMEFRMRINNPALTGQILVGAARAVCARTPGCYTMIEVPPIDFLEGGAEELIRSLV